jgi:transcriptional regulator with XRE-family HTH domain
MGIRENIRKELSRQGFESLADFCRKKSLSTVYLNQFLNNKRRYNEDLLKKISEALGVPLFQLFADEPLVPKALAEKDPTIIEVFADEASKLEYSKFRTRDDFLPIRVLEDRASLGHGSIIAQERTRGYALIYRHALPKKAVKQKRDHEKIVCLFAEGDSMEPAIQSGSMVAIDLEDRVDIKNYKIYAVEIPDEGVTIKRVYKVDHELILLADNRNCPGFPRCVHLDRLDYNPICGKVVWTWNRLD